ncbi:BrnA antitoxin family protein [Rhizobium sp. CC-YZS058]|uniref:BrnA antitoxin family protein n=1 Tax=Rhizobium sp. CC-YZS058 TaxID=3042153 RepID=UPI002B05D85A|nr:BrnA antitoxin family protein [Rhizobium sp. CC-YZS058]MEA3533387.1 BrnA antitoxin family protein [Rhizobium sp. CC-YZS058]
MRANVQPISPSKRALPTLEDVKQGRITLDEYERAHGEDSPELTEELMRTARPMREVFPEIVEALEKARGQRGPQKEPVKERVGLRLDRAVVEHFRKTGPGWQSRINAVLAAHVRANETE